MVYRNDIAPSLLVAEKGYGLLPVLIPKWKFGKKNPDETQFQVLKITHRRHQKIIQSP